MTSPFRSKSLCIAAAIGLISPSVLFAQASGSAPPAAQGSPSGTSSAATTTQQLSEDDREFVEKAASSGLAEVQMGQLATKSTASSQVKLFAERMVKDHGTANSQLQQIVSDVGMELPKQPDDKHQDKLKDLQKHSGQKFDREYMELMVKEHEKDVEIFEKYAKDSKHAGLKSFAEKNLPILREHLDLAKKNERALKN